MRGLTPQHYSTTFMPSQKATEGAETAPRRSTRISSQPVTEEQKAKKPKATAKRRAETEGTKLSNKKVCGSKRLLLSEATSQWRCLYNVCNDS